MKKQFLLLVLVFTIAATILVRPSFSHEGDEAGGEETVETGGNREEVEALNREIAERKEKIRQLEQSMETYKKVIEEKQTEAVSLRNQLSILDNHIAKAETDIALTEEKIKQAQLEIEALELGIADKEAAITKQKKLVTKMVQNINTEKQKKYLEILLTNDSFAEFYNQVQYSINVYTDLGRSVKILRLTKEDLHNKKEQVDSRKQTHEKLKAELEMKKDRLIEQAKTKEGLLLETKSSEQKYKTLLNNLRQQYQAIENEVRSYEEQVRKKLKEQERLSEPAGEFVWPVPSKFITATFHDPDYPFRRVFEHSGIDIRASQGTPVRAANSGYVGRARTCTLASCYSYVLLVHTGNLSSVYGHLSSVVIAEDQYVNKGDIIGYSGGKPGTPGAGLFVTGPHLHFEIRLNGIPVDPLNYLLL